MKPSFRLPFISPSTRDFLALSRALPGHTGFQSFHGYVYARWTYLYIALGTGEHPVARLYLRLVALLGRLFPRERAFAGGQAFADTYHGKVLRPAAARQLVSVQQPVALENLEQVIPYATARDLILEHPDHIVVLDCPCRSAREHPCLPLDVCLIVGEPFASFVREHHGKRSRWISQDEAVDILAAEHARGHVQHAFFKDAMLGRFYAICNCCSCCCGAMQAQRNGVPMIASSGHVAQVDAAACAGCGACQKVCQFGAIEVHEKLAVVDVSACMGCEVCASHCARHAITLMRDPSRGVPLELRELMLAAATDSKP
jgi:ferredoxin